MHFYKCVATLVLCVVLVGCSGPNRAEQEGWDLETAKCHFSLLDTLWWGWVECYRLEVPETRGVDGGRVLELGVYLAKARRSTGLAPIIMLLGGPGGHAEGAIYALLDHPVRETRDIIILEQRGAGVSQSFCRDFLEFQLDEVASIRDDEMADQTYYDGVVECFDAARADGIDIESYNTWENAADVADLRVALGLEILDLWAGSYGTILGQAYMELEPNNVGRALFDGTFDINVAWEETIVVGFAHSLENSWRSCVLLQFCYAGEPTFQDRMMEQIAAYAETPVELSFHVDHMEQDYTGIVGGDDVVDIIHFNSYVSHAYVTLPMILDQLETRSVDFLSNQYSWFYLPFLSEGMFYAMRCQMPRATDSEIASLYAVYGALADELSVESIYQLCDRLGLDAAAPFGEASTVINSPVLFMTGEWDPISPLSLTDTMKERFPNATYREIPFGGHGTSFWLPCAQILARDYFASGSTELTQSCAPGPEDYPSMQETSH